MRRIPAVPVILVLITLVIITSVYFVLKNFQQKALENSLDPFTLVGSDAEIVFHIKNPSLFRESFTRTGPLGQDMDAALSGGKASDFINRLDSVLSVDEQGLHYWNNAQVLLSVHPSETHEKDYLLQLVLAPRYDPAAVKTFLQESLFPDFSFSPLPGNQKDGFILTHPSTEKEIFFCLHHNILLISSAPITTELPQESTIISDTRFRELRNSSGRFSDNLYARTEIACNFRSHLPMERYPFDVSCTNLAGWQGWDVSYHAGELLLAGFAQSETYGEKFIDNLGHQQAVKTEILKQIPIDNRFLIYFGFSDKEMFTRDYEQWLRINNREEDYYTFRSRFQDITTLIPDSLDLWNGEAAWVVRDLEETDNGVLLVGMNGISELFQHPALEIFFSEQSLPGEENRLYDLQIYESNIPGLLPVLTSGLISEDFKFLSWSGEFLLAAHSPEILMEYQDAIRFGYSFERSTEAELMHEFLQPDQNIFVYHAGKGGAGNWLKTYLHTLSPTRKNTQGTIHHSFCMQIMPSPGPMVFSNIMMLQREEYEFTSPLHWETEIPAPVHIGPYRVVNHNTDQTEIILQDQSNNLHLIDLEGDILWSREISGPIMSDIFQVDIYKNNRYQYLFNTRNYLHLIDRNGDYVRGYPMRLPAPASAGIAVFDYEQNKNYRIVFPGENRRIYNYSLRREPVAGWQYQRSEHLIAQPLQHIRLKGMDFLFATDTTGRVHILDRRGTSRLRPNQVVLAEPGLKIYGHTPLGGRAHFIIPGPEGQINQVFTDGDVFGFMPDTLDEPFRFTYQEFSTPQEKDLIFLHKGNLSVYTIASRLLFSLPVLRNIKAELQVIPFSEEENLIALTDRENSMLFVVTSQGNIPSPFPIPGDTRFFTETQSNDTVAVIAGLKNTIRKYLFDKKELFDYASD